MKRGMPHYGPRRDVNEAEIVDALVKVGASVVRLSSKGVPDLLVGYAGITYLLEVKQPGEQLTGDQVLWHARWRGERPTIVTSIEQAKRAIGVD